MSENCRIKLNDVSLVLGGNLDCDCGCDCDDCANENGSAAYITAFNSIEGTVGADGTVPLSEEGTAVRNMTLADNAVTVGCDGIYNVSYMVRLNPRLNVSVALYRNGDVLDGTSLITTSGDNSFFYSGIFELSAGDVLTLICDTPSAELAGETNATLSLFKIAETE